MGNKQNSVDLDVSGFTFPGIENIDKSKDSISHIHHESEFEFSQDAVTDVNLIDLGNYYLIPSTLYPKKDKTVIKIVAISDTHGDHREIEHTYKMPEADILIHCGDFSNNGRLKSIKEYNEWIGELIHKYKKYKYAILIGGNHDVTLDKTFYDKTAHKWGTIQDLSECNKYAMNGNSIYLQDETVTVCGITFYGSPYQPEFCDWAFQLKRGDELRKEWNKIPEKDIDVLLTHGPPKFHGDLVDDWNYVGCGELLKRVNKINTIKYHIFGHVHEGYGVTKHKGMNTIFVNASTVNEDYEVENKPIMFYVKGKQQL